MSNLANLVAFWQAYLDSLPTGAARPASYTAWSFGHDADDADKLGDLVSRGVKTATCSLMWTFEAEKNPLPQVGELSIVLDGIGDPLCIIETTELQVKAYQDVDAQFAYDEGEGDRSLAYWREVHWRYFAEECAAIGREPSMDMPLLCERFRVVFNPSADS
ncbi:MAG: ASCH domain-containing protein [Anaerolineae bacterium]|nr:ASCH domain-containing protein [Anaerolineae bacterium]